MSSSAITKPNPHRRSSAMSSISIEQPPFLGLPHEILEQIFLALSLPGRSKLARTCSALRDIYAASAQLQYLAILETSAYLDYPRILEAAEPVEEESLSAMSSPPSSPEAALTTVPIAFRSPHTGNLRSTIPSVSLAPWPKQAPEVSPFDHVGSLAAKNRRLRDREERWETMEFKEKRTFKVQGQEGVYELQEGIFLLCNDTSTDDEERRPDTIRLIPLPSADDPDLEDPPISVKGHKLPMSIADLTMDPSQDLIVISEYNPAPSDPSRPIPTHRYHLLTMSSFSPHPLASLPTLDFPPVTQTLPRTRQLLQVMGDTLAVLVAKYIPIWILDALNIDPEVLGHRTQEEEIVVWNWKTGRVLSRLPFTEKQWFSSFAMLSPTTFMVTSTMSSIPSGGPAFPWKSDEHRPTIQIYSILSDPKRSVIPVQPLQSEIMDDTTPRPVCVAVLEMPTLQEDVKVTEFDVRPDPAYPPRPEQTKDGEVEYTLLKHKPFTQDPLKGILVFDYHLQERITMDPNTRDVVRNWPFVVFVRRETLVKLGQEGEKRLEQAWESGSVLKMGVRDVQQTFAWDEWGEKEARMMDRIMTIRSWVCSCSGYRYISILSEDKSPFAEYDLDETPEDDQPTLDGHYPYRPEKSHILLYDFNPYTISKELSRQEPYPESDDVDPPRRRTACGETFVPPFTEGKGWKSRVVTRPTILSKRSIFEEDVRSELPYREVWREYGGWANGIMIDDQRIIVVNTNARRNGDWSSISQEMTVLCM
ncbi:hypothetical protein C362_00133 [Cryptococcus neoformans Bt1]|nr:hypothetical protein C362_00133 [Cryptococcus neoformans var. grubii Bt1]